MSYPKSKNKKIICALSGGVDSAVAAALLKKANFQVIGLFIRLNDDNNQSLIANSYPNSSEKCAQQVAHQLDIPFFIYDARAQIPKNYRSTIYYSNNKWRLLLILA